MDEPDTRPGFCTKPGRVCFDVARLTWGARVRDNGTMNPTTAPTKRTHAAGTPLPAVNGVPAPPGLEDWPHWEPVSAQLVGENVAYFQGKEDELLREHPEWRGKYAAIAS